VTVVYRLRLPPVPGVSSAQHEIAAEGLARAVDVGGSSASAGALREAAAAAYCSGVQVAAVIAAVIMAVLAVVIAGRLRHIKAFGEIVSRTAPGLRPCDDGGRVPRYDEAKVNES
jgi:hypothetical protein